IFLPLKYQATPTSALNDRTLKRPLIDSANELTTRPLGSRWNALWAYITPRPRPTNAYINWLGSSLNASDLKNTLGSVFFDQARIPPTANEFKAQKARAATASGARERAALARGKNRAAT